MKSTETRGREGENLLVHVPEKARAHFIPSMAVSTAQTVSPEFVYLHLLALPSSWLPLLSDSF